MFWHIRNIGIVYKVLICKNDLCCKNCLTNLRAKSRETALSQMWRAWRHAAFNSPSLYVTNRHNIVNPPPLQRVTSLMDNPKIRNKEPVYITREPTAHYAFNSYSWQTTTDFPSPCGALRVGGWVKTIEILYQIPRQTSSQCKEDESSDNFVLLLLRLELHSICWRYFHALEQHYGIIIQSALKINATYI